MKKPQLSKLQLKPIYTKFLHLFISVLLVLVTPFILQSLTPVSIQDLRDQSSNIYTGGEVKNYLAIVQEVTKEEISGQSEGQGKIGSYIDQELRLKIADGDKKSQIISISTQGPNDPSLKHKKGDRVVVRSEKDAETGEKYFTLSGRYRLNQLWVILAIFIVLIVLLTGIRGLTSVLGLLFSIYVVIYYLIPQIIVGGNVLITTFITGVTISVVSMLLSHGFTRKNFVATLSTVITICISTLFAIFVVNFVNLSGIVSEEIAHLLNTDITSNLNIKGLLLSGVIISCLGVLDDVTSAQSSAIQEIIEANPELSQKEVFVRGLKVGQEHIISMVNTLALAYAGVSLPLLMLISLFNFNSLWTIINDELILEEIVRALIGSICLLMAVPITNFLSVKFLAKQDNTLKKLTSKL